MGCGNAAALQQRAQFSPPYCSGIQPRKMRVYVNERTNRVGRSEITHVVRSLVYRVCMAAPPPKIACRPPFAGIWRPGTKRKMVARAEI